MAEATFKLEILTPSRREFEGNVVSLVVPGVEGSLGVLAHHAPLITPLAPGKLEVQPASGEREFYFVSGGFLEVSHNHAIVLADSFEPAANIDPEAATAAVHQANEARRRAKTPPDVAVAELVLAEARGRLRTARRQRGLEH
jgi:F-type H+-transporting ATPase subunit epsilon